MVSGLKWCTLHSPSPMVKDTVLVFLTVLTLLAAGENRRGRDDKIRRAYSCVSRQTNTLTVDCNGDKINILTASYGYEPKGGDCNSPTEDTNCLQPSVQLSALVKRKCENETYCEIEALHPSERTNPNYKTIAEIDGIDIITSCGVGGKFHEALIVNYLVVYYSCIKYEFCSDFNAQLSSLVVKTQKFPERIVTNPTCTCTFAPVIPDVVLLRGFGTCNGFVTFTTKETDRNGTVSEKRYPCSENSEENFTRISQDGVQFIEFSLDIGSSSERSSYSLSLQSYTYGGHRLKREKVKVNCVKGSSFLP